jgi:uncharacterized protein (DUF433 family)
LDAPVNFLDQIEMVPGKRGGRPCLKGTRTTVADVLGWIASGMTFDEIIDDYPWVTKDGIQAAVAFAAAQMDSTHGVESA